MVSNRRDRSRTLIRQGPLAGRYPAVAAMVMFALIPYLALSAALNPLTPIIANQLHTSLQTMSLSSGLANAAYAVGTVLTVQLAQHLPQRRIMLAYAVFLVVGSVLTAAAQNAGMFIVGRVVQGLCTSLLLIAAVPPLALGYPRDKLHDTAVIMNLCIFGAVALGPFIGGLQAEANAWRPLFWIVAGISAAALLLAVLTFDRRAAGQPRLASRPAGDRAGHGRLRGRLLRCLTAHHPPHLGPRGDSADGGRPGDDCRSSRLPVPRQAAAADHPHDDDQLNTGRWHHFGAVCSGGVGIRHSTHCRGSYGPLQPASHRGAVPPRGRGTVVTAIVLGLVLQRRAIHYLPLVGMIVLAAGIAVFRIEVPPSQALTLVGSSLTGIGLGATVAPALFVAGFSLASANLQRVFAIVELLRAVAAFMLAPIFIYFASTISGSLDEGVGIMLLVGIGLAIAGAAFGVAIYALSGARRRRPTLTVSFRAERRHGIPHPFWPDLARGRPTGARTRKGSLRSCRLHLALWSRSARCSSPTTAPTSRDSRSGRPRDS